MFSIIGKEDNKRNYPNACNLFSGKVKKSNAWNILGCCFLLMEIKGGSIVENTQEKKLQKICLN